MNAERLADYGLQPMPPEDQQRRDLLLIAARAMYRVGLLRPLPPIKRPR